MTLHFCDVSRLEALARSSSGINSTYAGGAKIGSNFIMANGMQRARSMWTIASGHRRGHPAGWDIHSDIGKAMPWLSKRMALPLADWKATSLLIVINYELSNATRVHPTARR